MIYELNEARIKCVHGSILEPCPLRLTMSSCATLGHIVCSRSFLTHVTMSCSEFTLLSIVTNYFRYMNIGRSWEKSLPLELHRLNIHAIVDFATKKHLRLLRDCNTFMKIVK